MVNQLNCRSFPFGPEGPQGPRGIYQALSKVLLFSFVFPTLIFAENLTVSEVLRNMKEAELKVNSLGCEIITESKIIKAVPSSFNNNDCPSCPQSTLKTSPIPTGIYQSKIKIYFNQEGMFKVDYFQKNQSFGSLVYTRFKTRQISLGGGVKEIDPKFGEKMQGSILFTKLVNKMEEEKTNILGEEELVGEKCLILQFRKGERIWVSKTNWLPRKREMEDLWGNTVIIEYKSIEINPVVNEKEIFNLNLDSGGER